MRLLEIQRQLKKNHKFRKGSYVVEVRLEHPGDPIQEVLRITINENGKERARSLFKQWPGRNKWEPLSVTFHTYSEKKMLETLIYSSAKRSGYII